MTHRAEPFKLTAFETEAIGLVERAKQHIKEMLEKAQGEAEILREEARLEGYKKGFDEGLEKAHTEERERIREESAGLHDFLKKVVESIEEKRRGLEATAESELLKFSIRIAECILKREVKTNPAPAIENLKQAVSLTVRRQSLDVLVSKKDLILVRKYMPELKREFLDIADIRLRADETVDQGGCVVVTREGAVDAQIKTQLEELERQLLS